MEINKIICCDCLEGMKQIDSASIDLVVTDCPYGISFMGKNWDKAVPSLEIWQECNRVLKSGAFMFVMSIPRLDCQFEMAKRLKLAQFDIGFTPIYWCYSSGFPKAMNISKKVVDFLGVERESQGINPNSRPNKENQNVTSFENKQGHYFELKDNPITAQAKALNGSYAGFQPKPAVEVIMVAMKPLNKENYVKQALYNGKGITWLDNCRIPFESNEEIDSEACPSLRQSEAEEKSLFGVNKIKPQDYEEGKLTFKGDGTGQNYFAQYLVDKRGRFPANLLVSDDVLNDGKYSESDYIQIDKGVGEKTGMFEGGWKERGNVRGFQDSGSFSRYFSLDNWWQERIKILPEEVKKVFPFLIVPKASSGEKQEGLDEFENQKLSGVQNNKYLGVDSAGLRKPSNKNFHPTVKPLDLMAYLVTLGSRDNDLILDPFMGSGTTAIACRILNRRFIGFEINKEYHRIAEARLKDVMQQKKLTELNI